MISCIVNLICGDYEPVSNLLNLGAWLPSIFSLLVACIVSMAAFKINQWRLVKDNQTKTLDNLLQLIIETANKSTDYWCKTSDDEYQNWCKIYGDILRIVEAHKHTISSIKILDKTKKEISNLMADFIDAATGGDFGDKNRVLDKQRAYQVQVTSSKLCSELQRIYLSNN